MQIQTANYDLVTTWQGGMASRTRCQSMTGDKRQSHVIDYNVQQEEDGGWVSV